MEQTIVRRFEGDRALQQGINDLERDGWRLRSVSSRKAALGFLVGPFTSKSIHEAVFSRENPTLRSHHEESMRQAFSEWLIRNPRPIAPRYGTIVAEHGRLRDWEQRRGAYLASLQ